MTINLNGKEKKKRLKRVRNLGDTYCGYGGLINEQKKLVNC